MTRANLNTILEKSKKTFHLFLKDESGFIKADVAAILAVGFLMLYGISEAVKKTAETFQHIAEQMRPPPLNS